jgi:putative aldouronate transport system substrate-binding protein
MPTTFYNGKQLAMSELNLGYQDQMFWVREDWRLKLGLPEPKTTADFIALAEAFVKNDMAGNRQTIGFEVNPSPNMVAGYYNGVLSFDPFFNEAGAYPRIWHDDGTGKLVYGSVTPQAKEALAVLRDMYSKGLIAKDFSTRDQNASIASGYPGVIVGPWWTWGWPLYTTVQNNPQAIWKVYSYVSSKNGKANTFQQNYNGMWHIVRKGHKNPEALLKIMSLHAEFQTSNEASTLTAEEKQKLGFILPDSIFDAYRGQSGFDWGAWPTRLTLRFNDHIIRQATILQTQLDQYKRGDRNFNATDLDTLEKYVRYENGETGYEPQSRYMSTRGKFLEAEMAKNMNKKAAYYPSVTPTQELRWANLTDMEILAYTKIIMGQEPLSYFDTFVRDWNAQGGNQITEEVNQQYKAR